ncbi:beta-glucuronidase [Anaerococcus sp. AGMB09787]|uniref:beta-glucuronidase n=1 Tax=Anaerococcus sp. AGMB09787 TaxID=2922869 RepID=UPI001FAFA97C
MLYPILTDSRMVSSLDGIWNFKLDNGEGFNEKWFEKPLGDSTTMPVPSSYNDLKEGSDFRDHYGWVFYQRQLYVPKTLREDRLVLRFDAVTHHAKVYLNGEMLVEHRGGFLPFEVEIQDYVKDGNNLLTVAVDNVIDYTTLPVGGENPMLGGMAGYDFKIETKKVNNPNFDFFNYCGITRHVRLYTTPKDYIKDINVISSISGEDAVLEYKVFTEGSGSCKVSVYDEEGNKVSEAEGAEGKLKIENVRLWQVLDAYLYDIKVEFNEDEYILPYGVRTVEVRGLEFLINGEPFYFKGYGKHEDTFPNGRGINEAMNVKDLSIMKWQGCNSFRTSHYPYSEEMMRLCDREGFVVIDETPAVGINFSFGGGANFNGQKVSTFDKERGIKTFDHHKDVIKEMINRDKNHACVVMWSIANEADTTSEGAMEYFKPLFDLARETDPQNRPCTMIGVQSGADPKDDIISELSDVVCLNRYYGWYFGGPFIDDSVKLLEAELIKWREINKPVMFTEYGADTVSGFHNTTPVMYTEEYQVDYYKANNDVFDKFDFIIGEQAWNFADFATSQGLVRVDGNKKGLFTRDRKPKLVAHYFRERWNSIPNFNYKKNK